MELHLTAKSLFREYSDKKSDTIFFNIYDLVYAYFVKAYGCGILSYKLEKQAHNINYLSFYGDGILILKFLVNDDYEMFGTSLFMTLYIGGRMFRFGHEPWTYDELKNFLLDGKMSDKVRKQFRTKKLIEQQILENSHYGSKIGDQGRQEA